MTNTPNHARHRPPRILVVEDTALVADEIVRMLSNLGCESLGPVGTLAAAAAAAADEDLDGVLLDVNLGDTPAFPVADILLKRGVPFALLTGYVQAMLPPPYDAVPYLEKPFAQHELAELLRDLGLRSAP